MAKPMSSGSLRRLKDNNNESGRYESASSISGRQNRWATFTSSQGPNDRSTPAEEKARKSQVAYYKNLLLDGTEDDREKQPTQSKTDSLDDDFTLTSTFFPKHPTSSENAQNEDYPVPHPTGPSYQSSQVIEPALTNESRDVFTATYLIRRLNALERDTSNIHSASGNYQNMSSNSRIDDDTNVQTATDTDGDYEQSRMNQSNPPEEGRHSSNAFVTSRVAAHLSDRILGTNRPIARPKSTTITTLQNRTVLDIKSIQPPMQPPHLRRIAEQQYHQRQRVMMVFGKQTVSEPPEKSNLVPARTYHLSMNERRPDDLSMNYDSSSSVVSRLHPIPQDNYVPNTSTRFDSASFNKSQTIRISSVKKSSK